MQMEAYIRSMQRAVTFSEALTIFKFKPRQCVLKSREIVFSILGKCLAVELA